MTTDGGTSREPAPPTPPAPVAFVCPEGWRTALVGGASICEPWADALAPSCAPDELAVVGAGTEPACQPFVCPTGDWPDDAPADAVYARAGGTGDGTRASPFGRLDSASAVARSRGVALVIGEGEILANFDATGIPLVLGLCPARSRVRTTSYTALSVSPGGTTTVRGLTLTSNFYLGMELGAGAHVTIEQSIVTGATGVRLGADAVLDGEQVVIRGPAVANPTVHQPAIELEEHATVHLRRSTLGGAGGAILMAGDEVTEAAFATAILEDSAVLDTPYVLAGPVDATLRRVSIERVAVLAAVFPFRSVTLEDVRVRDVGATTWEGSSAGLLAVGGSVTLRRVAMTDVQGTALGALDEPSAGGSSFDAEDFVATDVDRAMGSFGQYITVLAVGPTSRGALRRVYVADVVGNAFQADYGAALSIADLTLERVRPALEIWGNAFQVFRSSLTIERVRASTERWAMIVTGDSTVNVGDLEVTGGLGIQAQCGEACTADRTSLVLARASVHDVARSAVAAVGIAVDVSDLDIARVTPRTVPVPVLQPPGAGLLVVEGGTLVGRRVAMEDVGGLGVLVYDRGSLALTGLSIERVTRVDCDCGGLAYGDGVLWANDSTVSIEDFVVEAAERAGLSVARGALASHLVRGVVRGSAIGILSDGSSVGVADFADVVVDENDAPFEVIDLSIALESARVDL